MKRNELLRGKKLLLWGCLVGILAICFLLHDGSLWKYPLRTSSWWHTDVKEESALPSSSIAAYRKAVVAGNVDAMLLLANAYVNGDGVPHDMQKAYEYFTMAAEHGDADAMMLVALGYDSLGIPCRDREKAVYWYTQAAAAGNAEAEKRIGEIEANE